MLGLLFLTAILHFRTGLLPAWTNPQTGIFSFTFVASFATTSPSP